MQCRGLQKTGNKRNNYTVKSVIKNYHTNSRQNHASTAIRLHSFWNIS